MKIHEYQAKDILSRYGVRIQKGKVCCTPEEARNVAEELGGRVVVKAQVHVGGRGKAGGIKLADDPKQAEDRAAEILGMNIKGITVRKALVVEAVDVEAEFYLGITLDRSARRSTAIVSSAGGIDIEQVAEETPEKIAKINIDPFVGLQSYSARRLMFDAGVPRDVAPRAAAFLTALYKAYSDSDAMLAEINPLALTPEGELVALDAKMEIDDSALFRHPEFTGMAEEEEGDPLEAEARRRGIQYVKLDGYIGVIGNGAGLVMATLDEVKRAGGSAADFLDIGGGAKSDLVKDSVELILSDARVKGLLLNVFGGITRCDEVAEGLLEALSGAKPSVPIVVRLTGTEAEAGRRLLSDAGLFTCETMQEAAEKIVSLTG